MLSAALLYLGMGWAVLPLAPREKRPLGELVPHGLRQASKDPEQILAWWARFPDANIGIATGLASWIYVVDLDGPEGVESWKKLRVREKTLVQRTGGGGFQVVYWRPETAGKIGNRTRILPGVDVRCDGGYIVAPPSVHPSGARYRWSEKRPIAVCPRQILRAMTPTDELEYHRPTPPPHRGPPRNVDHRTDRYAEAAIAGIIEDISSAGVGSRNHTLNRAAYSAGRLVGTGCVSAEFIEERMFAAALRIGLGETEARRTIRSGLRSGMQHPRELGR